jgi:hypothetical protein
MEAGRHREDSSSSDGEEVAKMRKTKDINIVSHRLQHERRKAERLHKSLHFLDYNEESAKAYTELDQAFDNIETLDKTYKKIKLDKELLKKDNRKVGEDGTVKWKRERKR